MRYIEATGVGKWERLYLREKLTTDDSSAPLIELLSFEARRTTVFATGAIERLAGSGEKY
jgi:hypothetical protein